LWDVVFLTYGIRAEWNPAYGEDARPNLAPRYGAAMTREFGSITAKLRGSYGRATRPPGSGLKNAVADQFFGKTYPGKFPVFDSQLANPDLGPEFQRGGEGGVELYLGNRVSLVVTRYNQTVNALISYVNGADSVRSLVPDPYGMCATSTSSCGYQYVTQAQYLNIGNIRNQGWEIQGTSNIGPFNTRGTYSWSKSRVIGVDQRFRTRFDATIYPQYQPGSSLNYLPEHTWGATIGYARAATTVALTLNGTGLTTSFDSELKTKIFYSRIDAAKPRMAVPNSLQQKMTRPGYTIADFNASQQLSSTVASFLQVLNIADYYRDDYSNNNASMGRQTRIGVRVRL
jgi:hypothetical protein